MTDDRVLKSNCLTSHSKFHILKAIITIQDLYGVINMRYRK